MAAKVTKAGLLGSAVLNEFGDVATPYTVPENSKAAVTITLCNGSEKVQRVRVGYAVAGVAPNSTRWLLGGARGFDLPAGGTEQVTTMLGAGQGVAAKGPIGSAEISVTVNGQEETLA